MHRDRDRHRHTDTQTDTERARHLTALFGGTAALLGPRTRSCCCMWPEWVLLVGGCVWVCVCVWLGGPVWHRD